MPALPYTIECLACSQCFYYSLSFHFILHRSWCCCWVKFILTFYFIIGIIYDYSLASSYTPAHRNIVSVVPTCKQINAVRYICSEDHHFIRVELRNLWNCDGYFFALNRVQISWRKSIFCALSAVWISPHWYQYLTHNYICVAV